MMFIKFESLNGAYSGRPGCCCGCKGKHYKTSFSLTGNDYTPINDKQVRRIFNKIEKVIENFKVNNVVSDFEISYSDDFQDNCHIALLSDKRTYIIYFRSGTNNQAGIPLELKELIDNYSNKLNSKT